MNPIIFLIELARKFWTRPSNEIDQIENEAKEWYKTEFPTLKVFGFELGQKVKPIFEHWATKLFLSLFMFVAVQKLRTIMTEAGKPKIESEEDDYYEDERL